MTYYGQTERHLDVRADELISTTPSMGKRVNNKSGHLCSFDDLTVLSYGSQMFKRLIKEFLLVTIIEQLS